MQYKAGHARCFEKEAKMPNFIEMQLDINYLAMLVS